MEKQYNIVLDISQYTNIAVINSWSNTTTVVNGYIIVNKYNNTSYLLISDFNDEAGIEEVWLYDIMDITNDVVTIYGINGSYSTYDNVVSALASFIA